MSDLPEPKSLFDMSDRTLQDLVLASLDRSARHLKAAKVAWAEAVREQAVALAAQYFIENRAELVEQAKLSVEAQTVLEFPKARSA